MKSYKILFFATNRHQETYFRKLLEIIREGDEGILLHQRRLAWMAPVFTFRRTHLDLIKEVLTIRLSYFYNKTGRNRNLFWQIVMSVFYFLSTTLFISKMRKILSTTKIDMVVLWNDMKWHQYVIKTLAQNSSIKTIFFENGALPNTVTLDSKGVNFNNSVPRMRDYYEEVGAINLASRKQVSINEGYIFVPFQVDYDTQIISHSPWIKNMEDFYYALERLLDSLPNTINIVIKEHPKSSRKYDYLHKKNSRITFNNTANTDDLVQNSSIVMTVNSTVGLEAIIKDKATVVLGNAFYGIDGLCQVVQSEHELVSQVLRATAPDVELKNKFIEYLEDYYVSGDWHSPTSEYINSVEKRIYRQLDTI